MTCRLLNTSLNLYSLHNFEILVLIFEYKTPLLTISHNWKKLKLKSVNIYRINIFFCHILI